jgi:hypothetical protein
MNEHDNKSVKWLVLLGVLVNALVLWACVVVALSNHELAKRLDHIDVMATERFNVYDAKRFAHELQEANPTVTVPEPRHAER